jgi:hypothetical protein
MGEHGFKKGKGGGSIVAEIQLGTDHGFAGLNEGGKVKHTVERLSLAFGHDEKFFKGDTVGELSPDKLNPWREQFEPAVAQVVESNGFVALCHEESGDSSADIAGTTSNQYFHEKETFLWYFGLNLLKSLRQSWSGLSAILLLSVYPTNAASNIVFRRIWLAPFVGATLFCWTDIREDSPRRGAFGFLTLLLWLTQRRNLHGGALGDDLTYCERLRGGSGGTA